MPIRKSKKPINFNDWSNPEFLEARPQELIVPMVKAIQELCARIEALENE